MAARSIRAPASRAVHPAPPLLRSGGLMRARGCHDRAGGAPSVRRAPGAAASNRLQNGLAYGAVEYLEGSHHISQRSTESTS
jgi:hypothetical protein